MSTDVPGITGAISQQAGLASRADRSSAASGAATESTAPGVAEPVAPGDDAVELSTPGKLQAITDSLRNVPVVDAERVQAVRESIASGERQIDSARVADKLFELENLVHPFQR